MSEDVYRISERANNWFVIEYLMSGFPSDEDKSWAEVLGVFDSLEEATHYLNACQDLKVIANRSARKAKNLLDGNRDLYETRIATHPFIRKSLLENKND